LNASAKERNYYVGRHLRPALRRVWAYIVKPIFEKLDIPLIEGELPQRRIWWYLTGPLTFIPIHAAGPLDDSNSVDVTRLVISSYVTTLSSLRQAQTKARHGHQAAAAQTKLLAVSQPNTPGQSPLPYSSEELKRLVGILRSFGWSGDDFLSLDGSNATVEAVSSALEGCSCAHFACHAIQAPRSPMESAFLLHDGTLTINEIALKRLTSAQLAFLSVCHGASGLRDLPGEAMHLAAALNFAGFPSVIATMWGIRDEDGPEVVEGTYRYLFRDGERRKIMIPDPEEAAAALNRGVIALRRNRDVTLDRWAAFIHIGV
jgi:CHAT domain-containing protein